VITLFSTFRANSESAAEELRDRLLGMVAPTRGELGSVTYEVLVAPDESTALYVIETWNTCEDAERHALRVVDEGLVSRAEPLLNGPITSLWLEPATPAEP
jgi:quinol monooxygenase YgiN